MNEIYRDLRFAARLYRKSSVFAATTVVLLALSVATNTVIFSVIDALFLRPLSVEHPEQIVRFVYQTPGAPPLPEYGYPLYTMLRDGTEAFSGALGERELNVAIRDGSTSERIRVDLVTGNYFSLLGVRALYGRVLTSQEEPGSGTLPVVLSHMYWQRRYGGDPRVIGRAVWLQGRDAVIVGVTPREFNGISVETSPDIRIPFGAITIFALDDEHRLQDAYLDLTLRLRPGVTSPQASAEFARIFNSYLRSKNQESHSPVSIQSAARGVSRLRTQLANGLIFLMGAAGLLLLIVCANIAGLLLARSAARKQEMAVRAAVGASGGRLIRQMLAESALLMLLGGAGGWLLALAGMRAVTRVMPPIRHLDATSLPLAIRIEPDLRTLGFSLLLCALTAVLFGLGPAFQVVRRDFYTSLKSVRSTSGWSGRHAVVVAQIALCTFLLVAAGLLLATFARLRRVDPGFDRDHVVTFSYDPETRRYSAEQAQTLERRLLQAVRGLPGVEDAALASRGLMRGTGVKNTTVLPGQQPNPTDGLNTSLNIVSPTYFSTMGMRLLYGRNYREDEPVRVTPTPMVVNQAFTQKFFPGLDALGRRFGAKGQFVIIGVVSDAKYRSLREPIPPTTYALWRSTFFSSTILHVRTRFRPESLITPVQEIMRRFDPELPFYEIKTLAEEVDASLWSERVLAGLVSTFAVLAALLAAIGVYGLISYTIAQRTTEIGIRMALGATPRRIVNLVSSQAFGMILGGIGMGLAGALAAAPSIRSLLYDVPANDARALAGTGIFVALIALAAIAIPAIRAARLSPADALRYTTSC